MECHWRSQTATCIGDVYIDHIEMQLYDCYRKQDGEEHSYDYLLNCRVKLMDKVQQYKDLNKSEEEMLKMTLTYKKEIERIRQLYQTIAIGQSRSGNIVRTVIG